MSEYSVDDFLCIQALMICKLNLFNLATNKAPLLIYTKKKDPICLKLTTIAILIEIEWYND